MADPSRYQFLSSPIVRLASNHVTFRLFGFFSLTSLHRDHFSLFFAQCKRLSNVFPFIFSVSEQRKQRGVSYFPETSEKNWKNRDEKDRERCRVGLPYKALLRCWTFVSSKWFNKKKNRRGKSSQYHVDPGQEPPLAKGWRFESSSCFPVVIYETLCNPTTHTPSVILGRICLVFLFFISFIFDPYLYLYLLLTP